MATSPEALRRSLAWDLVTYDTVEDRSLRRARRIDDLHVLEALC